MPQSHCNLLYHIVFSTKRRRAWIDGNLRARLIEYLGGAVVQMGGVLLEANGASDHVHILAKLRQDKALSDVVRTMKAASSGWVHKTFSQYGEFDWQDGYGAFTVSVSQVNRLTRYIADQEQHHRRVGFKEEFLALLKAHGIEYDERYLWD